MAPRDEHLPVRHTASNEQTPFITRVKGADLGAKGYGGLPLRLQRRRRCAFIACLLLGGPLVAISIYFGVKDATASSDGERFLATPYNVTCSDYDDDVVYTATSCADQDYGFCYGGDHTYYVDGAGAGDDDAITASYTTCVNGTACYDWCDDACVGGWGAYCVWDIYANLEAACAGNYTPTAPGRRRLAEMNWGTACGYHARCEACNASETTCDDVYHEYYCYDYSDDEWDDYSGNPQAAAALEPNVFETWCDKYGFPYAAARR